MWQQGWRNQAWKEMDTAWDMLVIGGGITGAGIMNMAARAGLRVLLVDQDDFAFGTSSRSSKLVHGGFRYLRNRQFDVTRELVRERERLLRQAKYLVTPLKFLLPVFGGRAWTRRAYRLGVTIYDLLAPKWAHGHLAGSQIFRDYPVLTNPHLSDGFYYYDAEVDDSRLVLRVIQEGMEAGGCALNYTKADHLLFDRNGMVCGAHLVNLSAESGENGKDVEARVVIHAAGPCTDLLRSEVDAPARIRKQRGSHLIFSRERLPLDQAITFFHPRDKRAMFVFPWEGVTIIGTTDLDHPSEMESAHPEPYVTRAEVTYMFEALAYLFPQSGLTESDVVSSFSGLRPIVRSGAKNPSKESRAHSLWDEKGLVTITGGKLTTYRIMALETLNSIRDRLPGKPVFSPLLPMFQPLPHKPGETPDWLWQRLAGRYGSAAPQMLDELPRNEMSIVGDQTALWAEIRWAARSEAVEHLDDLLLRRVRLGMTAPAAGKEYLDQIRQIAQPELGWDDVRWQSEVQRYLNRWQECYSLPDQDSRWSENMT